LNMSKQNHKRVARETVIGPGHTERNYWRDLWLYRELFYILSWRDLKVRYKQTLIGVSWSVIRPFLTTVILTFLFSRVAHLNNPGGAPYALMVFAGMLPWQFFSNALSEAGNSLIYNSNLITKVYFPRLIIPASSVFTGLVDFFISFCILLLMFLWYGYWPDWKIVFLPFMITLSFLCALGFGLFLAALNVRYRDFRYVIPFLIQIGLYISPVGFSSSVISASYRWAYSLNPMTGIIDGFRWCLLGDPLDINSFLISLIPVIIVTLVGIKYFRRVERSFADTI